MLCTHNAPKPSHSPSNFQQPSMIPLQKLLDPRLNLVSIRSPSVTAIQDPLHSSQAIGNRSGRRRSRK